MEIEITGLEKAIEGLKKLDEKMQGTIFKAATKAGAKVILAVAETNAPKRSGFMASMIKIRSSSRPSKGIFRSSVGVGEKDWTGPAFYASFILFGHKVGSRKLGDNRKSVAANEFLRKSAKQVGEQAAQAMIEVMQKGINE